MTASFWHKQLNGWQRHSKRLAEGTDLDRMTPFNLLTLASLSNQPSSKSSTIIQLSVLFSEPPEQGYAAASSEFLQHFICVSLLPTSYCCWIGITVYMALLEKISSLEAGLTVNIFGSSIVSNTVAKKIVSKIECGPSKSLYNY